LSDSAHRHAQSIGRQRQAAQRAAADVSIEDLTDILPQDASPLLPDAAPVTTPADEALANLPRPSWRDREPAIVHSPLKWKDSDGHEHLHIVRGDVLDAVLLHLRKVKVAIAAARAREGSGDAPATGDTVPTCPDHHIPMRTSKYRGFYCTHKTADGVYCTRKVKGK
jgi:hypothetical protein